MGWQSSKKTSAPNQVPPIPSTPPPRLPQVADGRDKTEAGGQKEGRKPSNKERSEEKLGSGGPNKAPTLRLCSSHRTLSSAAKDAKLL